MIFFHEKRKNKYQRKREYYERMQVQKHSKNQKRNRINNLNLDTGKTVLLKKHVRLPSEEVI